MIVRLTHNMAKSVKMRVDADLAAAMDAHRVPYGATQHDYTLPAIGWRRILDCMIGACYGPAGGRLGHSGRPSNSAFSAIGRIAKGIGAVEAHPALRNAAAMGWHGDVVPVWVTPTQVSPYPIDGGQFELLVPEHIEQNRSKMTVWHPARGTVRELVEAQSAAYSEDFQLLLCRGALPSRELSEVPEG